VWVLLQGIATLGESSTQLINVMHVAGPQVCWYPLIW